ncbi:MAG: hypothetical protein LBT27_08385, partial [Prevotellaceae bacterium]|nr:hypothetical protein [Prevotellaceae bacterium]
MKKYSTFLFVMIWACALNAQPFSSFPPDSLTAKTDRDQMLWQLGIVLPQLPSPDNDPNRPPHIKSNDNGNWTDDNGYLPNSPVGYLITRTEFGLWLNYIEEPEKTGIYTPVNLLKTISGENVETPEQWWKIRRPELEKSVKEEIWGIIPDAAHQLKINWNIENAATADSAYGRFTQQIITGNVDISSYPELKHQPKITGRLYLPENAVNAPVIIQYAWLQWQPHPTYLKECISRGWGFLQLDCNAIQPDNGQFLTDYVIGLVNKGNWRKPSDWGTLAAWSWGVSRLIDFFENYDAVDAKRIGITGHSRYGKAALVTAAYETRIAVAYVSCSGAAGAAPMRRNWGQSIESVMWHTEYHWLAGNFMKWCGSLDENGYLPRKTEKLPVDAHALLAMCAPRPVFVTGGTNDNWCDPLGMFLTTRNASPAYELLGVAGLATDETTPLPDKPYMNGNLAYRLHIGGHVDFLDWALFAAWTEKK